MLVAEIVKSSYSSWQSYYCRQSALIPDNLLTSFPLYPNTTRHVMGEQTPSLQYNFNTTFWLVGCHANVLNMSNILWTSLAYVSLVRSPISVYKQEAHGIMSDVFIIVTFGQRWISSWWKVGRGGWEGIRQERGGMEEEEEGGEAALLNPGWG